MVGAVLGIVQAGVGLAGLISSSKDKDKGIPEEAPELRSAYQRAVEQSKYGYDAQQKAAFDQKLAAEGNTAYRKGVDMGGGSLSAAVNSGIHAMQLNARNEFAMNDASLKMQKQAPVYSLAGQIQGQNNLKAGYYNQQYNAEQQAYGGALKAGTESFGNAIKQNQYMDFMKDMYGQNGGANTPDVSGGNQVDQLPTDSFSSAQIGDGNTGGIQSSQGGFINPYGGNSFYDPKYNSGFLGGNQDYGWLDPMKQFSNYGNSGEGLATKKTW
jgi:hypothetical protein